MTDLVQQPFAGHEVLPLNSTPMERAMADVSADFLLNLDIPISTLWNPYECPEQYLPFLAWSLSVDVWDADWTTAVKRRVIAASPMVHRRKGTRWAVEQALASLGISTEISEWWETVPPKRRGTFEVVAYVTEQIYSSGMVLDERITQLAYEVVKASKPKSRIFDLLIGVRLGTHISVASAVASLNVISGIAKASYETSQKLHIHALGAASSLAVISGIAAANYQTSQNLEIRATCAASSLNIIKLQMELSS